MGDVSEVRYSRALPSLELDRRWAPFRAALTIAEIVLRHGSVELADGATASLGFLVDMDRLFEDVVIEGVREFVGREGRWVRHPSDLHLDVDDRVPIFPDAVWYRSGRAPLVVDAKYKATLGAKRVDLYQVAAYCQAIGAERAVVVYADVQPGTVRVRRGGPSIELVQLDLDCDLDVLRERLRSLAERLGGAPS
jgi:5-methylcytosine-specific restriction enzyme subunit McrC